LFLVTRSHLVAQTLNLPASASQVHYHTQQVSKF
jgi:hypothetical protein